MKVSKRQLRRIIKEEKRLLSEQGGWGESVESGSDLIEFAKAYAGLGGAVQQQFDALAAGWIQDGAHEPAWSELVYEQNPNAIDMAASRLQSLLKRLSSTGNEDAELLLDMLEDAQEIYRKGDEEVASDRAAAAGRPPGLGSTEGDY